MDQNQLVQTLEDIQQRIADTLGLSGSNDEKHLDLIDKATDVLLKKIFLDTIEKLPEADADAYAKLIDDGSSPEDMQKFLSEKIPGYSEFVKKIVEDFLSEMKEAGTVTP